MPVYLLYPLPKTQETCHYCTSMPEFCKNLLKYMMNEKISGYRKTGQNNWLDEWMDGLMKNAFQTWQWKSAYASTAF